MGEEDNKNTSGTAAAAGGEDGGAGEKIDFLKPVPKPDNEKKDSELRKISEKIDRFIEERNQIDKQQQMSRDGNKPYNDKRRALVKQHKTLWDKRKKLMDEANSIKEKIDKLKAAEVNKKKQEKAVQDGLKYKSVADCDAKISALEKRHETTSMSMAEEKALMKEIANLKQTRRKLEELDDQRKNSKSSVDNIPALRTEMKAKRSAADEFKDEIERLKKELDELSANNSDAQKKADKLKKKRDDLQNKINKLFAEKDELKKTFNQEWKAYKTFLNALNKKRDQERKEREEQRRKEREEYERRLEEEEMKKKPWEEEIALCDFLIQYLEGKTAKKSDAAATTETPSKPAEEQPEIRKSEDDFQGLKAIGKKANEEESFLVMGGAKKKKSNKKKQAKKTDTLTHSLDLLSSFALLDLQAPIKVENIPASIKELQEKRAYYDVLPRAPRKKASTPAPATAEGSSSTDGSEKNNNNNKKKGNKGPKAAAPTLENSELFPSLPGSKLPQQRPLTPPNGPSAVDMVKNINGTPRNAAQEE